MEKPNVCLGVSTKENINMVEANGILKVLHARPAQEWKFNPFKTMPRKVLSLRLFYNHKDLLVKELEQMPKEELVMDVL